MQLSHARSLLFLPASNGRAIEKARGLPCDMVILDLEDSVADDRKEEARAALPGAFATGFGGRIGAVRINAAGHGGHAGDIAALAGVALDFVVLPKVERPEEAAQVHEATGRPVIAMIESPPGVVAAQTIAATGGVAGLFMGNNDLRHALRIPLGADRSGLMLAMQTVILSARLAGRAVFDGVYNRMDDSEGFAAECREGRALGFDGKTLIHPSQIADANAIFGPDEQELAEARALIAAAVRGGAERHGGAMIEEMHVRQAKDLLARAGEVAGDA